MTFLKAYFTNLSLIDSAQHEHSIEEHDHVASQHLPHVKEDSGEADIIEAPCSEGIHLKPSLAVLILTYVDHGLLHLQAVLVSNLKLEPDTTRLHMNSVLWNLQRLIYCLMLLSYGILWFQLK